MENRSIVILILMLVFLPALVFGYDNKTVHPMLTIESIKSYELSTGKNFSLADKQAIINGSIEEDTDPRYLEHFYDPINNVGLGSGKFATSKQWAHNQTTFTNDYSWENGIYEYVYGDKVKGLNDLGHIIHLVEDKTVPEHTRDDAHAFVSTYESYTKNLTSTPSASPIYLSSIDEYFDQVAKFTNSNFFSDDTILKDYSNPKIMSEIEISRGNYLGLSNNGFKIVNIKKEIDKKTGLVVKNYSLSDPDNQVMSSYWNILAPRAVGYSAGVINLFFAEVEKEKQTHILQKAREPWWQKLIEIAKIKVNQALALVRVQQLTSVETETKGTTQKTDIIPETANHNENRPTLEELEQKLLALQSELNALKDTNQEQTFKVISSINRTVANIDPNLKVEVSESSTTEATSTATTTEEIISPLSFLFSIKTCDWSLASDFCLLISTSSLSFSWQNNRSEEYVYDLLKITKNPDDWSVWNQEVVYSGLASSTTIPTNLDLNQTYVDEIKWQLIAKATSTGEIVATSSEISTFFHPRPLVINEISWAGTASSSLSEWLELKNYFHDRGYSLDNFYLVDSNNSWRINLSGQIKPDGYYLIERGSSEIFNNRTANLLANWGAEPTAKSFNLNQVGLRLYQIMPTGDRLIDETPNWNLTTVIPSTLERTFDNKISTDQTSWENNQACDYGDNNCAFDQNGVKTFGTPGIMNNASVPRLI